MAEEEEGLLSMTSSMTSSANLTVNPFETASLDSLHLPAFSPSVFKASQNTPCSKKKSGFRWSIDQMSLLYPADIDELPQQQDASFIPKEKEEQVQDAINQFFSQKVVVPSPWSESKPMKHVTFSPKPPTVSVLSEHSAENSLCSSTNGSFLGNSSGKVDVSCQTAITLPLNFDLQAFLGKGRFMYTKTSVESFPVAPLRRKLFTQSESSASSGLPSASPLSASSRESGPFSPSISPIKSSQESSPVEHIPCTPNSVESQFSSSPIARFRTTPLRPAPHVQLQASPLCGKMVSPLMSPIRETPQGSGLPRSPTSHDPVESLSTGDHVSPVIIKGNSLYHHARPSENMMETSLSKAGILDFRPQMADVGGGGGEHEGIEKRINFSPNSRETHEDEIDGSGAIKKREELSPRLNNINDRKEGFDPVLIIEFDENDGEEELVMERRKDFTLGLAREFSPIQKIGDHISTLNEPGCSSRLHGTQEESSMDTSLMSNRGQLRQSIHASSPPRTNIPCDFSLEASTALSPIPKTGDLSLPLSPVRTEVDETKDGVEIQSFRPKGRHKMVSFHIGTEFSPIRYPESGSDHISGQTMPITSSRVHESNTELLMETSLFSLNGQNEGDESERVENLGADDAVKVAKNLRSSPQGDYTGLSQENNVPDRNIGIHKNRNYLESSSEGLQQKFAHVQTTPKESMKMVGIDHEHLLHERREECVTTGTTDSASSQYPPMSSVRDGVTSSCSRSCESCDHSSACWAADWTSSSLKRDVHPGERWNSPMTPVARLTSTMRYGTPSVNQYFGPLPRSDQSATPSMNFSSVSLIANASSNKEVLPSHQAIDHPCDTTEGSVQQESSKNLRFDQVQFYDRVEDCRMQTSFKKAIPSSMTMSRSYDSLQKYALEKENTSAQEDWLMTSLSEADLHQSRTSSEVQDMMADRDSIGTTSTSFIQNANKHGEAMQKGPNTSASFLQHGIGEHLGAAQQGHNTHSVFQRSTSDPLRYPDSEMPSHAMKGVQEGNMSNNFETPCIQKVPENGSASKLHEKVYPSSNVQEGHNSRDMRTKEVSPLRPISVNLLSHITRTGVDSGYNTNSANVSMDIGELENSS